MSENVSAGYVGYTVFYQGEWYDCAAPAVPRDGEYVIMVAQGVVGRVVRVVHWNGSDQRAGTAGAHLLIPVVILEPADDPLPPLDGVSFPLPPSWN